MASWRIKRRRAVPGFLLTAQGWPYLLVPFIPLAIVARPRPRIGDA